MNEIDHSEPSLGLPRDKHGLVRSAEALQRLEEILSEFLEKKVFDTGADGLVVTLNGTLESIVAATIAVDAVGTSSVTGLIMPTELIDEAPARDAEAVADMLGVQAHRLQLHPVLVAFHDVAGTAGQPAEDIIALENATERFRMICKYYFSRITNRLVVGTTTRTDLLVGSTAKYAASAVDLSLFGDIYATELASLAESIEVPLDLVSEPQIHPGSNGQRNADALGIDQASFDIILRQLIDEKIPEETVASQAGVDSTVVQQIKSWTEDSAKKRNKPWKPSMTDRTL